MSHPQREHLSGSDALLVLETIQACLAANGERDLRETVYPRIEKLFSFDYAVASLGTWQPSTRGWSQQFFLNRNLPDSYWLAFQELDWTADPVVAEALRGQPHQHWSMTAGQTLLDTGETRLPPYTPCARLAMDYGVHSGYTSTIAPLGRKAGSYSLITFCTRKDDAVDPRTRGILAHLTPHLHQVLVREAGNRAGQTPEAHLSGREIEVLNWLKAGKSSWDISMVLGISERTVNFHVYNLMRKLGALNRPQAVAIAAAQGVIGLD